MGKIFIIDIIITVPHIFVPIIYKKKFYAYIAHESIRA